MANIIKKNTVTTYDITLSVEEITALYAVLWHVGGRPTGPRGHIDSILEAITEASGVDYQSEFYYLTQGSMSFNDDNDYEFNRAVKDFQ